jgi:hypothetical protein
MILMFLALCVAQLGLDFAYDGPELEDLILQLADTVARCGGEHIAASSDFSLQHTFSAPFFAVLASLRIVFGRNAPQLPLSTCSLVM